VTKPSGATYTAARIAQRIKALGREISRSCRGRRLDVVVNMDRAFVFAADLIRAIDAPVVVHFVREDVRDVDQGGLARREVFFANREATACLGRPEFKGRDVLVVDAVIDSGVTQDFLLRRIGECQPRSLRLAVLLDKPARRHVALEPDYFGFQTASNQLWTGYGLAAANGTGRNAKHLVANGGSQRRGTPGQPGKRKR
jgi:hypoxanthine phosphoribosyltransferase